MGSLIILGMVGIPCALFLLWFSFVFIPPDPEKKITQ